MKVYLGLIAIYIFSLCVNDVYSQDNNRPYRRFEILVTGLRHQNYYFVGTKICCNESQTSDSCTVPCDRSPSIIINGMPAITFPPIGSNIPPPDGDFVFNNVWEDDEDIRVFVDNLNVSIEVVKTNDGRSLGKKTLDKLRFAPNTDKVWRDAQLTPTTFVNILISYWCKGYTGMNCEFPCDTEDPTIECDYKTGEKYCVNNNPNVLDCSNSSDACDTDVCNNNGICHMPRPDSKYCECNSGFEGQFCEYSVCKTPCDPDNGHCVNGTCQCDIGWEGETCAKATCNGWSKCQNNGQCMIDYNDHACNCDPVRFAGPFCDKLCAVDCAFGTC